MKLPIQIIYIVLAAAAASCGLQDFKPWNWAADPELELSSTHVVFDSSIGEQSIEVKSNYGTFKSESNEDWCVPRVNIDSSRVEITVEPNDNTEERIATVEVSISQGKKSMSRYISVIQKGGVWDIVGEFNIYWRREISQSQKDAVISLIESVQYVDGGTIYLGENERSRPVTISGYYLGRYEVTQRQWSAIMADNPSQFRSPDLPVENISWLQAYQFVTRLAELTNIHVTLPTEAQWEYAARGGMKTHGYRYAGGDTFSEVGHFVGDKDSPEFTIVRGGTRLPNELGLYDMSGNVSEMCSDWYDDTPLSSHETDPTGPDSGTLKVVRGGDVSFYSLSELGGRGVTTLKTPERYTGFRIVINK